MRTKKKTNAHSGGVIARKCQKIDSTLGYAVNKFLPPKSFRVSSWFISGMDHGGLLYPTEKFFGDLQIMNERFERYHGKLSLDRSPDIITTFAKVLQHYFPSYDLQVLEVFSLLRTGIQIRKMNAEISKYQKLSVRGRLKNAELAALNS